MACSCGCKKKRNCGATVACATIEDIEAAVAGGIVTPLATVNQYGKAKISYPAAVKSNPIAVGNNEPFVRAFRNSAFLELYTYNQTGIDTAIAAIGSTRTRLKISAQLPFTADTTFHANTFIEFDGDGSFSVATTKTVNVLSMANPGLRKVFYTTGTGQVLLGQNAVDGPIRPEWWMGAVPSGDNTHDINQAFASASLQGTATGGGTVLFGAVKWKASELILPNDCHVMGSGMDPDAGHEGGGTYYGTVGQLFDETKGFLFKAPDSVRNSSVSNMALSVGAASSASCILYNVLSYGDGFYLDRVSVQGTYVAGSIGSGVPLIKLHATAGQEAIRNVFDHVWFQVPENGRGFGCDTPNTTQIFRNCKGQGAKGSIILDPTNCGPIIEEGACDWEGVDDFTDLAHVFQRSIDSASVVRIPDQADPGVGQPFSTITLDPATLAADQFEPNDKGRSCRFSGFDAYITRIVSPFVATLSFYPASDITSQPCEIHTFTDFPNTAYAVRRAVGNVVSWTCNSSIDEGFNYSLIAGTGNYANFQLNNCFSQGRIKVVESCKIDINGGHLPGFALEDGLSSQSVEVNINDVVFSNTYYSNNLFALTPDVWRVQRFVSGVSSSYSPNVKGVFPTYDMFADTYDFVSARRITQSLELSNDYGTELTEAPLRSVSYERHQSTDQKDLIQFGQWDVLTNQWVGEADELPLNYGLGRSDLIGRAFIRGGQIVASDPRLVGLDLPGDYAGRNFRGGGYVYPSQSSNFTLDISQHIERYTLLSSSVDQLAIAGCFAGVTRDGTTGLPTSVQYPYEEHFLVNTNTSRVFYLKNEDTDATATNRWRTNSGKTITFRPDEILRMVYDPAISRFRVAPLGIGISPVLPGALFLPDEFALGTTGAQNLDCSKLVSTFMMAITGNVTLTPTNLVGGSGQVIFLNIVTTNTSAYTLTFASPFKTVGGLLVTSAFAAISQNMIFKERAGALEEFSRSGVMS